MTAPHHDRDNSTSSLYERVPDDCRALLDRAIINRRPATYRKLFDHFQLDQYHVSFSAFWRYAHRLRRQADHYKLAELAGPQDDEVLAVMPSLLGHRLVGAVARDQQSSRTCREFFLTYRDALRLLDERQDRQQTSEISNLKSQQNLADSPGGTVKRTRLAVSNDDLDRHQSRARQEAAPPQHNLADPFSLSHLPTFSPADADLDRQKKQADVQLKHAEVQRKLAEAQLKQAEAKRKLAEAEQKQADTQQRQAEAQRKALEERTIQHYLEESAREAQQILGLTPVASEPPRPRGGHIGATSSRDVPAGILKSQMSNPNLAGTCSRDPAAP